MKIDVIEALGIDEGGSLWVRPATATFPFIYREAMEVHWDAQRLCLYSPKPREWSYTAWFRQIRNAAREQGVDLRLGPATTWNGIDPELQKAFANGAGGIPLHGKS
jgi:Integron Cassette Protein Hfx_Cass5